MLIIVFEQPVENGEKEANLHMKVSRHGWMGAEQKFSTD